MEQGSAPTEPSSEASSEAPQTGEGEAPTSTAEVSATDFPYAWYLNLLRKKISDEWDPPASRLLAGRSNHLMVRFTLARNGSVSDLQVESESGAPGLDSSARRAVDRAQPFPPLPDGYPEDAVDIAVRFTVSEGKP
jgi:TonB family protein